MGDLPSFEGGQAVSDTPRTDEFDGEYSEWSPAKPQNWPAFARQIERELNTARKRIKRLYREIELLRLYGNKDCTAMADEALAKEAKL
jgi:hypothetical protein